MGGAINRQERELREDEMSLVWSACLFNVMNLVLETNRK